MRMTRIEKTAVLTACGMFAFLVFLVVGIPCQSRTPTLERVRRAVHANRYRLEAVRLHFERSDPVESSNKVSRYLEGFDRIEWTETRVGKWRGEIHGTIHSAGLTRSWHRLDGNWWGHRY